MKPTINQCLIVTTTDRYIVRRSMQEAMKMWNAAVTSGDTLIQFWPLVLSSSESKSGPTVAVALAHLVAIEGPS